MSKQSVNLCLLRFHIRSKCLHYSLYWLICSVLRRMATAPSGKLWRAISFTSPSALGTNRNFSKCFEYYPVLFNDYSAQKKTKLMLKDFHLLHESPGFYIRRLKIDFKTKLQMIKKSINQKINFLKVLNANMYKKVMKNIKTYQKVAKRINKYQ